jgi:hypothetical protein
VTYFLSFPRSPAWQCTPATLRVANHAFAPRGISGRLYLRSSIVGQIGMFFALFNAIPALTLLGPTETLGSHRGPEQLALASE